MSTRETRVRIRLDGGSYYQDVQRAALDLVLLRQRVRRSANARQYHRELVANQINIKDVFSVATFLQEPRDNSKGRTAGARGRSATPMPFGRRLTIYRQQNGTGRLTPAQRRRFDKSFNRQGSAA